MKEYLKELYAEGKEEYFTILKKDLKTKQKRFIITVNPETLMQSEKDPELKSILNNKKLSYVPDSIAIIKAAQKNKITLKERIPGIEIADFLLKEANNNKYSMYLFGAKEEVLIKLVTKIKNEYPNINILGYTNGYTKDKTKVMAKILNLEPDITLVALGIPLQEKLIASIFPKAKKGIYIGVGGSFDVLSGTKKRAPKIMQKLNLEWLYRLIKEPNRLKRFYNNNIKFIFKLKKDQKRQ